MKASAHFKDYVTQLIDGLVTVDNKILDDVCDELITAYSNGKNVFVCGNGGSAAISEHFTCDHSKGVHHDTGMLPQVYSLSSNMSLVTAIANDISYSEVFSYQLNMKANPGDVLIVISSSGQSPNIIKALETAKKKQMTTVSLVGFDGGMAKQLAQYSLHVNSQNYGVVEDAHQALMHIIAQSIRITYLNRESIKL